MNQDTIQKFCRLLISSEFTIKPCNHDQLFATKYQTANGIVYKTKITIDFTLNEVEIIEDTNSSKNKKSHTDLVKINLDDFVKQYSNYPV